MGSNSYYTNFSDILLLRRYHSNLRIYFDASDVLSCVQGIYDYYSEEKKEFKVEEFKNKEYSLVRALLNLGLLGKIHLSLPHQLEFISVLERNDPNYSTRFRHDLRTFVSGLINENDSTSENVNKIKQSNKTALKILMFLYPNHWKSRAHELITEKGYIEIGINNQGQNVDEKESLVPVWLVATIYQYLEEKRPGKTINNENDAKALHLFAQEVNEANRKIKSSESFNSTLDDLSVPIYFDPNGQFNDLLEDRPAVAEYFNLILPSNEGEDQIRINLIRESKFFFCYSLYIAEKIDVDDAAISRTFFINMPEHSKALLEFENFLRMPGYFASPNEEYSKRQSHDLNILEEKLDSYINYGFIVNVVIPCFMNAERKYFLNDLQKRDVKPHHILFENDTQKTKDYEHYISKVFKDTKAETNKALLRYSKKYGFLFVMMNSLPKLYTVLMKFENMRKSSSDLFHIVSLTRFFMPKEIEETMSNQLLCFGELEKLKDPEYVTNLALKYKSYATSSAIDYHLYETLSLIWLTSRYHYAFDIYHSDLDYNPSLLMLFGANFVRDDETIEDGLDLNETRTKRTLSVIQKLESQSRKENQDDFLKINCSMAIAFLQFQLVALNNNKVYTKRNKDQVYNTDEQLETQVKSVLTNIDYAYEIMNSNIKTDIYNRFYITNLKIYYNVELGTDEKVKQLAEIITYFINQDKAYPSYWHYRYDDTISRYYYRISNSINVDNDPIAKQIKFELCANSFTRIKRAFIAANHNTDFRDVYEIGIFKEQVDTYFASIVSN